jgi:hypothetical protein
VITNEPGIPVENYILDHSRNCYFAAKETALSALSAKGGTLNIQGVYAPDAL